MKSNVWITTHEGKMSGIRSISTNPLSNDFCKNMNTHCNDSVICTKCYATTMMKYRESLKQHMEANSKLLSENVLCLFALPKYNDFVLRFNSFGEIINATHLINIFNICYNNPQTFHVVYTKRANLFEEFIHLKPLNLRIIESNPIIDKVIEKPVSPIADMVFNVVTPEYLINHPEYRVNCIQSCQECMTCYSRRTTIKYIVELIK